jgi:hypothetical protein
MTNIRAIDMQFLDDLFEMGSGYVLNFTDRTFAQFFAEELNINIDDPIYARAMAVRRPNGCGAFSRPWTSRPSSAR